MQHYYNALLLQPSISDCKAVSLYPVEKLCLLPPPLCTKSTESDSQSFLNSFFFFFLRLKGGGEEKWIPLHKKSSELALNFNFNCSGAIQNSSEGKKKTYIHIFLIPQLLYQASGCYMTQRASKWRPMASDNMMYAQRIVLITLSFTCRNIGLHNGSSIQS